VHHDGVVRYQPRSDSISSFGLHDDNRIVGLVLDPFRARRTQCARHDPDLRLGHARSQRGGTAGPGPWAATYSIMGVVVDLGCGAGRALQHLRRAVGGDGVVIGADVPEDMLRAARDSAQRASAALILADAETLPVVANSVDAIFAAGLLTHVPNAHDLLVNLARSARSDCRLALFHPVGRATLARRHERSLRPDELLDPSVLPDVLGAAGWVPERIDDAEHRYLALAH
jgi:SAM-dependent methyltransferase